MEDEFINEIVTLLIPTESENLEAMLRDEFVLKRKLKVSEKIALFLEKIPIRSVFLTGKGHNNMLMASP